MTVENNTKVPSYPHSLGYVKLSDSIETVSRAYKKVTSNIYVLNLYLTPAKQTCSSHCDTTVTETTIPQALLKVHPDKNMGDFKAHWRATERFKLVNRCYEKFKESGSSLFRRHF